MRRKLEKAEGFLMLDDDASELERFRFQICREVFKYSYAKGYNDNELAKLSGLDVSNLNKIVVFYEEMGALELKESTQNGRHVKKPIVPYDAIKIDLKAA